MILTSCACAILTRRLISLSVSAAMRTVFVVIFSFGFVLCGAVAYVTAYLIPLFEGARNPGAFGVLFTADSLARSVAGR